MFPNLVATTSNEREECFEFYFQKENDTNRTGVDSKPICTSKRPANVNIKEKLLHMADEGLKVI